MTSSLRPLKSQGSGKQMRCLHAVPSQHNADARDGSTLLGADNMKVG